MHTLGIDIGSTATKAVIVEDGERIRGQILVELGAGTSGSSRAIDELFRSTNLSWDDIAYTVATGYGRNRFEKADKQMSELSCHAKGMHLHHPEVHTIIDIGGQDAKVLHLNEAGMLDNFVMNEKCAAGTGRFLDVMAKVLESSVDQLAALDAASHEATPISSTCTVFAESEVISHLAGGKPIPDIVAGIHESVAKRTAGLARRLGIEEKLAMSGGVARNQGVVRALERELGCEIIVPADCQFMGALGAALFAYRQANR